jgi:transcriptional regulator with GAF, ATPase, and Fis domain
VLISGASGTGKELVAVNIHYESKRKLENFVPINCGSIPHDLLESELFGYEKGSFTGANTSKRGLFEQANHGTIFLDEVAELPLPAQVKLLRVIQDGEIEKIGRTEKIKVDVRLIAATNKILQKEVSAGRFREDLFYRLHVVPLHIPPLKERPEDILVLWEHYMRQMSIDMVKPTPATKDAAFEILKEYPWSGNVRELMNVVQRLLLREENVITPEIVKEVLSLHPSFQASAGSDAILFGDYKNIQSLHEMERVFRKKYFAFIRKNSTSDADAARKLGLAPPNYHRMCKELGLKD